MRSTRTRMASVAVAATLALATGCAAGGLDDAPDAEGTSPSASSSPHDEPVESTEPEGVELTTQNGTASFTLPADWTVRDTSSARPGSDDTEVWVNELVQTIPLQDRVTAAAWWVSSDRGDGTSAYWVQAALIGDPSMPSAIVDVSGGLGTVAGMLEGIPECVTIDSEESAVACLESDAVTETLEVLATFERHDVPEGAMP